MSCAGRLRGGAAGEREGKGRGGQGGGQRSLGYFADPPRALSKDQQLLGYPSRRAVLIMPGRAPDLRASDGAGAVSGSADTLLRVATMMGGSG